MREESARIVHSQGGGRSNYFAFLAARVAQVPATVATVANRVEDWADVNPLCRFCYATLNRLIEKRADQFICVSKHLCQVLMNRHHIAPERIIHIPNGVDVKEFECKRSRADILRELALSSNKVLVSLIGRLVWEKGVNIFLEAACELCKHRRDIHFLVVGDGPLKGPLEKQAWNLGLSKMCSFAGFRSDIADILKATDILALPSFVEGLPMIILEAMASKIPVVASTVGGIPEMIQEGKNGFLIPPNDSEALARNLLMLVSDKALRRSVGEAAKKHVIESFTETEMIHRTQRMYLDLIEAKSKKKECIAEP
jgi:glycosyltransferase involved in cell wall biosynthesis